jgi:hypothetical protein
MWNMGIEALPLLAPIATAAAVVVQALIRHQTAKMRERARSERLEKRLERLFGDCTPAERAQILRALRRHRDPLQ